MSYKDTVRQQAADLPAGCGVYIMKDAAGSVVYVGKAVNIRARVMSYFRADKDPKTSALVSHIQGIEYVACEHPAQALVLEAALIKEKQPRYNIDLKDNKSYPCVEMTREAFPRVFVSRPRGKAHGDLFGPYTDAGALHEVLQRIRKIFPYRSCRQMPKKPCLYFHLQLCPGPCSGVISSQEYAASLASIGKILLGHRKELIADIEERMRVSAQQKLFEKAAGLRDTLTALQELYSGTAQLHELAVVKDMLSLPRMPLLIEAFDISNTAGAQPVGSMVSFHNGRPDTRNYRRFRIKAVAGIDDFSMIAEVVRRRYSRVRAERKKLPDLILIDGGQGHVNRAQLELTKLEIATPVIGLAKEHEEIWFSQCAAALVLPKHNTGLQLLQRVRDEAHRFARVYHVLLRKKKMMEK